MNKHLVLVGSALVLAGCQSAGNSYIYDGRKSAAALGSVNVPVVTQTNYAFDVAAPGGNVPPAEAARLSAWFDSLGLQYGDVVYVEGDTMARSDVAAVAGRYGLLLSNGAPVTEGALSPGSVRVIVGRATASVPNCPNWRRDGQPNPQNMSSPNYGCGVNGALAAMIANPNDLVYGREGTGLADTVTAARAIETYRENEARSAGEVREVATSGGGN